MRQYRLFALALSALLALTASAFAAPDAETHSVAFTVEEARYSGSVVSVTVRATPRTEGIVLAGEGVAAGVRPMPRRCRAVTRYTA